MSTSVNREQEMFKPLLDNLQLAIRKLDIYTPEVSLPNEIPIAELRRGQRYGMVDKLGMITLTSREGVLQWEEGVSVLGTAYGGLERQLTPELNHKIVAQYKFEKLAPSKISGFVDVLDNQLTPQPGLHRWRRGSWQAMDKPTGTKPILLFIHGAFGDRKLIFDHLNKTPEGRSLLQRAVRHYGTVAAFEHPTLSVSPVLNALDLARLFAGCTAPIDVVCHGRGGLVARWWLECFRGGTDRRARVVSVGAPLGGTSLANPPRLRAALGLLTNVGHALSMGGDKHLVAVPLLKVAIGLIKVITSITSLGAKAPLMEASIAMIPGLAGQTRQGNAELSRLHKMGDSPSPEYFAVRCNFEPAAVADWLFQKRFVQMKSSAATRSDVGPDCVFEEQNDMVVDSASMTELFDPVHPHDAKVYIPDANIYDFGTTDRVHHLNYFRQPETSRFIAQSLKIP